jgi:hypothetical protein
MYHFDVKLSCGVYEFDWTFFMKAFGITITYVIILIQFKNS